MSVQQGALNEAAGTVWAGENWQGEVGEGVPQQRAQGQLGEVTHTAAQALETHVAQQVVSDSLRRRQDRKKCENLIRNSCYTSLLRNNSKPGSLC